jgi:hypothetical protein
MLNTLWKRAGLLLSALVFALVGCASNPIEGNAVHGKDTGSFVVGTIAPINSFEWKVAPLYTRSAVIRRTAAAKLQRGQIDVPTAQFVQGVADLARSKLDQAVREDAKRMPTSTLVRDAEDLLNQAAKRLN